VAPFGTLTALSKVSLIFINECGPEEVAYRLYPRFYISGPAVPHSKPFRIWVDLLLYPTHTLPTAAAPVLVGVGLAIHDHVFAPLPAFLGFMASWLIHVSGVLTDNYVLLSRYPEVPEHPELLAALRKATLKLRMLRLAATGCIAAALLTGPYLWQFAGLGAVALGCIGIGASLGYSLGGPLSLTRLGIADAVFFLMFGIVAVAGTYYVQAVAATGHGVVPWSAFVLGLPVGALVTNVLLIDDLRDQDFDRAKGWRTGPVRLGAHWTRCEFVVLTAFAYAMPLGFWLWVSMSPAVLLTWLTLPSAFSIARTVWRSDCFSDLHPLTPRLSTVGVLYARLLAIGIAASQRSVLGWPFWQSGERRCKAWLGAAG